jgi:hypothetical protein
MLAILMSLSSAQALSCPLSDSLAAHYGISFSGFSTTVPESAAPDTTRGGPFVRVRVPDASNVADGFHHTIVMDLNTKKIWILRTGGFVGVYQWHGPVDAVNPSLDNCRLEPADGPDRVERHG